MTDPVSTRGLRTRPPFSDLYPVDPETRDKITDHVRAHGFDGFEGLDVWMEPDGVLTVVDGHTRLGVAKDLGIERVPVNVYAFRDEVAALDHALHKQRDRRSLEGAALVKAIEARDALVRQKRGGNRNPFGRSGKPWGINGSTEPLTPEATASAVAAAFGVSESTVKRARSIYDDPEAMADVESGASIAVAGERARARKRATPPKPASRPPDDSGRSPGAATDWSEVVKKLRVDDEPWFKAKTAGDVVESICKRAANEIAAQVAALERSGFDLSLFAGPHPGGADGKAVTAWNNALKTSRATHGLVKRAVYGPRGGKDDG